MRWFPDRKIYRSLKAGSLQEEIENSLTRLGVDTIDLYQIHWPNPEDELEEAWETLAKFQEEGKVRYIGVSNFNVEQMKRVQAIAPITSLQPPYSLLRRKIEEEILPFCRQHNIGVINYSPMVSGLLTGKMTAERVREHARATTGGSGARISSLPNWNGISSWRSCWARSARSMDVQAGVVAIAWTLRNPAITAAIVGARRPDQVDGILPAATFRLSDAEASRIEGWLAEHP